MSTSVAAGPVSSRFVSERFELNVITQATLKKRPEPWAKAYGPFSQFIFYRTYSRDGERWWQVIRRVIEGTFSIRKSHYVKEGLAWDEEAMQRRAHEMALSAFDGEWGPPGRGYWAMGTEMVYQKGSMALNNCGFIDIKDLGADLHWAMDGLMMGVGIGFSTWHDVLSAITHPRQFRDSDQVLGRLQGIQKRKARVEVPEDDMLTGDPYSRSYHEAKAIWNDVDIIEYVIPDSREGWCDSVKLLVDSYTRGPEIRFDYSRIRPKGSKISGFGGEASGPWPLRKLHRQIRAILNNVTWNKSGWSNERLICDLVNLIGCCIVAGNVRRSATIALGHPDSKEFAELKNYNNPKYFYRRRFGWMSNNSYVLSERDHFTETLPRIAEGIKRNGEPGFYNLKAVRAFGRLGDRVGTTLPNGSILREDLAVGINPCVTAETKVLTRAGYRMIGDLAGNPTEIWNGHEWSEVMPRVTGVNQEVLEIGLSNGTKLRVTPYHAFMLKRDYQDSEPTKVEARELRLGDKLWKYEMPVITEGEEVDLIAAYTQGLYSAEGFLDKSKDKKHIHLYGPKRDLVERLRYRERYEDYSNDRLTLTLDDEDFAFTLFKNFVPAAWSIEGRLAWLAGLIDGDGFLTKDGQLQITSIDIAFLNHIRLMLTTMGVQAKVRPGHKGGSKLMPDGQGGQASYECKPTARLLINAMDVKKLRDLGLAPSRIDISMVAPNRDAAQFVQVESLSDGGRVGRVYCFNEPKNHTGTFNGIVTGNCGEVPLEDKELCCLAEWYPTNCLNRYGGVDYGRALRAAEHAAFYTQSVQLLMTHRPETNLVIKRNRRTGVSLAGAAALRELVSMSEAIALMEDGYATIRAENKRGSFEAGVPEAIRVTAEKPSGTTSLMMGVPAGCHWPTSGYIKRAARVDAGRQALREVLDKARVPHEPDLFSANTEVYYFPVKTPGADTIRPVDQVSMWEQADFAATLAQHFVDNAVSVTVTFDPLTRAEKVAEGRRLMALYAVTDDVHKRAEVNAEFKALQKRIPEGDDVERLIASYAGRLKSMSMLPRSGHGYAQAPETAISRNDYMALVVDLNDFDWSSFHDDGTDETYCGSCQSV